MWIVALALRRPYTFVVMALVLLILTPIVVLRMPVDVLPDINIPVVSVVWNYAGMSPEEMADRIVSNAERGLTITVNDIEHIESQSLNGIGVIKIFFQPTANIQTALAQTTAMCQTTLRGLPPGTTPPLIVTYSASSTPIVQLGLSSKTLPEQQLFDLGNNFLRTQLATVPGAATPYPYGGKIRQIQVDLGSAAAAGQRSLSQRHRERAQHAEPDSSRRHRQDWFAGISGRDERQSANHRGVERPSGQDRERIDHLHARCGAHPRWLRAANQHRAYGRSSWRFDVDVESRQRVHDHHRRGREAHGAASRLSRCRRR